MPAPNLFQSIYFRIKPEGGGGTYAPDDLARLTLNDVRSMEHNAQVVEEQSLVFPCDPSVQLRVVPW